MQSLVLDGRQRGAPLSVRLGRFGFEQSGFGLGTSQRFADGRFGEIMEHHGKSWNIMERHGTSWKIMENHGICSL